MFIRILLIWSVGFPLYASNGVFTPNDDYVLLTDAQHNKSPVVQANGLSELEQAYNYVIRGRETNDPRFYGLAETLLGNVKSDRESAQFAILKASVLQQRHAFAHAKQVVEQALIRFPQNAQLHWLMYGIKRVTGQKVDAVDHCDFVETGLPQQLCRLDVATFSLESNKAESIINYYLPVIERDAQTFGRDFQRWAYQVLFATAEFHQLYHLAETIANTALSRFPLDERLAHPYADLLIKSGRSNAAIALLAQLPLSLATHVRLAVAEKRGGLSRTFSETLVQRSEIQYAAFQAPHAREIAMYYLFVKDDYAQGLAWSKRNWSVQKELIDYRLQRYATAKTNLEREPRSLIEWRESNGIKEKMHDILL